jgi:hypothetical protein
LRGEPTDAQEENRVKIPYRFVALLSTVALAVGGTTAFAHDGGGHHGKGHRHGGDILRSGLVGSTPNTPLFDVPSGGAPWTVAKSKVRVRSDRVRVRAKGLLLINAGAASGTTGPVKMVRADLFCNGDTAPAFMSDPVPLDPDGDFRIDQDVTTPLPSPCLAPAVLVRIVDPVVAGEPYIAANGGNAPAAAPAQPM